METGVETVVEMVVVTLEEVNNSVLAVKEEIE